MRLAHGGEYSLSMMVMMKSWCVSGVEVPLVEERLVDTMVMAQDGWHRPRK